MLIPTPTPTGPLPGLTVTVTPAEVCPTEAPALTVGALPEPPPDPPVTLTPTLVAPEP